MLSRIGLFSLLARSSASLPQGYQSTGLFACCKRYGLVSFARRLGIVRRVRARQFVGSRPAPTPRSNYTELPRTKPHETSRPADAPADERVSILRRVPWWPVAISAVVLVTAAFSVDASRDAVTLGPVDEAHLTYP